MKQRLPPDVSDVGLSSQDHGATTMGLTPGLSCGGEDDITFGRFPRDNSHFIALLREGVLHAGSEAPPSGSSSLFGAFTEDQFDTLQALGPSGVDELGEAAPVLKQLSPDELGGLHEVAREMEGTSEGDAAAMLSDGLALTDAGPQQDLSELGESAEADQEPEEGGADLSEACSTAAVFEHATEAPASSIPLRGRFEEAYGEDFSGVEVHRGAVVDEALDVLGADGAQHGDHILLGSDSSDRTVGHELAHVAQERRVGRGSEAAPAPRSPQGGNHASEREADELASNALAGERAVPEEVPSSGVKLRWNPFKSIKKLAKKVGSGIVKAVKGVGKIAKKVGSGVVKAAKTIGKVAKKIGSGVAKVVKTALKVGISAVRTVSKVVKHLGLGVVQGALGLFKGVMKAGGSILKGIWKSGSSLLKGIFTGHPIEGLKNAGSAFWDGLKGAGGHIWRGLRDAANGIAQGIFRAGIDLYGFGRDWIEPILVKLGWREDMDKLPQAPVPGGSLYGPDDKIDPLAVDQGTLGDCWFLASVAAVARSRPEVIRNMIKDNGDGTYSVTFHEDGLFFGTEEKTVTVSGEFPVDSTGNFAYAAPGPNKEIWVMVLEKAWAAYKGSYTRIDGGFSEEGMEPLTGKNSSSYFTPAYKASELGDIISEALANHQPVTVSTYSSFSEDIQDKVDNDPAYSNLASGHVYAPISVSADGSTITLQNPWGKDRTYLTIPMTDFKKAFVDVAVSQ